MKYKLTGYTPFVRHVMTDFTPFVLHVRIDNKAGKPHGWGRLPFPWSEEKGTLAEDLGLGLFGAFGPEKSYCRLVTVQGFLRGITDHYYRMRRSHPDGRTVRLTDDENEKLRVGGRDAVFLDVRKRLEGELLAWAEDYERQVRALAASRDGGAQ